MKQWVFGAVFGLVLSWTVISLAQEIGSTNLTFTELPLEAGRGEQVMVPPSFGQLVEVVENSEVHHLYFQDSEGTIRIVRIGPKSAAQQARHNFELLTKDVLLIERKPFGAVIKKSVY